MNSGVPGSLFESVPAASTAIDAVRQALRQRVQTAHLLSAANQRRQQIVPNAEKPGQAARGDLARKVVAIGVHDADVGSGAGISAVGSGIVHGLEHIHLVALHQRGLASQQHRHRASVAGQHLDVRQARKIFQGVLDLRAQSGVGLGIVGYLLVVSLDGGGILIDLGNRGLNIVVVEVWIWPS